MTYITTAGRLGQDQWDSEIRFEDRLGNTHQGLMSEVAHYTQPDRKQELDAFPRTVGIRFVGEPRAVFVNPDVVVTVAGEKP